MAHVTLSNVEHSGIIGIIDEARSGLERDHKNRIFVGSADSSMRSGQPSPKLQRGPVKGGMRSCRERERERERETL